MDMFGWNGGFDMPMFDGAGAVDAGLSQSMPHQSFETATWGDQPFGMPLSTPFIGGAGASFGEDLMMDRGSMGTMGAFSGGGFPAFGGMRSAGAAMGAMSTMGTYAQMTSPTLQSFFPATPAVEFDGFPPPAPFPPGAPPMSTVPPTTTHRFSAPVEATPATFGTTIQYPATSPAPAPPAQGSHILVVGYAHSSPENRDHVVDIVQKLQEESRKSAGCITYNWSQSLDDPNMILISELWESDAHLQKNLDSEHVKVFKELVPSLFVDDPVVQKATVTNLEDI